MPRPPDVVPMPLIDQTAQEYVLAARCPRCHHQPVARYSPRAIEWAQDKPLEEVYRDERCDGCGLVYLLAWVAVAYALPVRASKRDRPWAA